MDGCHTFNSKRYFGGCQIHDMNDEILDNELSSNFNIYNSYINIEIFMNDNERKKID